MSGYDSQKASENGAPWRGSLIARVEGIDETLAQECFQEAYQKGVDAQCELNVTIVARAKAIFHEYGHTVVGAKEAFRFLEAAVQIWTASRERSLPRETEEGAADSAGRGDDLQAVSNAAAEERISDPDR